MSVSTILSLPSECSFSADKKWLPWFSLTEVCPAAHFIIRCSTSYRVIGELSFLYDWHYLGCGSPMILILVHLFDRLFLFWFEFVIWVVWFLTTIGCEIVMFVLKADCFERNEVLIWLFGWVFSVKPFTAWWLAFIFVPELPMITILLRVWFSSKYRCSPCTNGKFPLERKNRNFKIILIIVWNKNNPISFYSLL